MIYFHPFLELEMHIQPSSSSACVLFRPLVTGPPPSMHRIIRVETDHPTAASSFFRIPTSRVVPLHTDYTVLSRWRTGF